MNSFRLILVDPKEALVEQWRAQFDGLPDVQVVQGVFQDLPEFDCIVSPANSFGLMDGGVDAAITQFFGVHCWQSAVTTKRKTNSSAWQPARGWARGKFQLTKLQGRWPWRTATSCTRRPK